MVVKKRSKGQPTKYKKEYCQKLIDHMSEGYSFETFAAILKVDVQTLYNWVKAQPDFFEAKKMAFAQSQLFWEKVGIQGTTGKMDKWNPTGWIFNMKNRFNWSDRTEKDDSQNVQPILINMPISGQAKKVEMREVKKIEE